MLPAPPATGKVGGVNLFERSRRRADMSNRHWLWLAAAAVAWPVAMEAPGYAQQDDTASASSPEVEAVGGTTLDDSAPGDTQKDGGDQKSEETESDTQSSDEPSFDAAGHYARASRAAERGSYDYAINLFEEILRKAPQKHPKAHYNLGSIYRAKRELSKALLHYQAYIHQGSDTATIDKAKRGVERAVAQGWNKRIARLSVDIEPETNAEIYINGYLFATDTDVSEVRLYAGDYEVWGTAKDHIETGRETVTLEMQGSGSVELRPKRKIYTGKMMVDVDQKDAQIRLKPRTLNTARAQQETVTLDSPMSKPAELVTGEYLLEVTKDDYHRWVRYVDIDRDETSTVNVDMSKKLPAEIR
jgi:hypothetical protein